MRVSTRTTASRWAVGVTLAAALVTAGCGGDSGGDATAPASTAPTSAAATTPPDAGATESGAAPGTPGAGGQCSALLAAATTTLTEVGQAGTDLKKAGTAWTGGAAKVRTEAQAVGGEAGTAGTQLATTMETAGRLAGVDNVRYVAAARDVTQALTTLATRCGVG